MATLLDLPNEIILQIIEHTVPDGIESLSECNKRIRHLATEALFQHEQDNWFYSLVRITELTDLDDAESDPLDLLEDILRTPHLALYPRNVFIGEWWERYAVHSSDPEGTIEDIDDELKVLIRQALENCPYVSSDEVDAWSSDIERGNADATMALLLTLLPNVRHIYLWDKWFVGDHCWDMLNRITEAPHKKDILKNSLAFRNLAQVEISTHLRTDTPEEADFLRRFAGLPSLTKLRYSDVECSSISMGASYPVYHGGVTGIEIMRSTLHPQLLATLLERTRTLEAFTYHFCGNESAKWFPSRVCEVLQEHAAGSLEHLDLKWDMKVEDGGCHHHLGDLRQFGNLKRLSVNIAMLNYEVESGLWQYKRLAKLLPASVEELELVGGPNSIYDPTHSRPILLGLGEMNSVLGYNIPEDMERLFDDLGETKAECLPNLRKIIFLCFGKPDPRHAAAYQRIQKACEKAGLAVEGLKSDGP